MQGSKLKGKPARGKNSKNYFFKFTKKNSRWVFANPEKLGAHCMKSARELYQKIACDKSMIREGMLARIIVTLVPFWNSKVTLFTLKF